MFFMRGQAAAEYLMTYGWAILVLIVVLAVLFSTGIMTPNYLISEECSFGTNLQCNFALFNENDQTKLVMNLFNGFPYEVEIKRIYLQTEDGTQYFTGLDENVLLDSGENYTFSAFLTGTEIPENTAKRFRGNITYVLCNPGP